MQINVVFLFVCLFFCCCFFCLISSSRHTLLVVMRGVFTVYLNANMVEYSKSKY